MKVIFCTPSLRGPTEPYIAAMEAALPIVTAAGWEEGYAQEVGCPYISAARARLAQRALKAGADVLVYVDYDLSFEPRALLTLLETPGDVVAGTYRFRREREDYMGAVEVDDNDRVMTRPDGMVIAEHIPAGFLKLTRAAVDRFTQAYPELVYGEKGERAVDLFNHGAHGGLWWGEDYAFARRWRATGGEIVIVPDLDITHHAPNKAYPGNFKRALDRLGWIIPKPEGADAGQDA